MHKHDQNQQGQTVQAGNQPQPSAGIPPPGQSEPPFPPPPSAPSQPESMQPPQPVDQPAPPVTPEAPSCGAGKTVSPTKEKIKEFKLSFKKNWGIFKQSKLGLVGITIIAIFVFMALGSPFFGLRDPVRWMAPEKDIIRVSENYNTRGSGAVSIAPVIQYNEKTSETAVEKVFVGTEKGMLMAIYPWEIGAKRIAWSYPCAGPIMSEPRIKYNVDTDSHDDVIYVTATSGNSTSATGYVYSIFAETSSPSSMKAGKGGTLSWKFQADGAIRGGVGIDPAIESKSGRTIESVQTLNELYVGTDNGTAYALADNGKDNVSVRWQVHLSNATLLTPVIDHGDNINMSNRTDDVVYFPTEEGKIYALRCSDGSFKWLEPYELGSKMINIPAVDFGSLTHRLIAGDSKGRVHFIDPETGKANLVYPMPLPVTHPQYKTHKVDPGVLTTPYIKDSGEEVYVGSTSGVLYALRNGADFKNGQWNYTIKWNYTMPKDADTLNPIPINYQPTYDDGHSTVFIAINGKKLFVKNEKESIIDTGQVIGVASQGGLTWLQTDIENGSTGPPSISLCFENNLLRQGNVNVLQKQLYVADSRGVFHAYDSGGTIRTPLPPSWAASEQTQEYYILGTDREGRDIFSQLITGSRIALAVGILSAFFSVMLGTIIGITAGYFGGTIDTLLMRLADVILVLPGLPILIIFSAVMGPSIWNLVIIIALLGWAGSSRIIRSVVLSLKERPFIESAKVTGASNSRIMFKHIAPNVMPLSFLFMTFAVTGGIIAEAGLSFLGLGDPTVTSWGQMLYEVSHGGYALTAWWWVIPPGLFVTLICLGFFLLGRAFDEVVNPRLRKR